MFTIKLYQRGIFLVSVRNYCKGCYHRRMTEKVIFGNEAFANWIARMAVGTVFVVNLGCAFSFIAQPDQYSSAFEIGGVPGRAVVQAFGILFLMWNATYPPVLLRPQTQLTLFGVILIQQIIGLAGETWMWHTLPPGHPALTSTGLRFIIFDSAGLILMGIGYLMLKSAGWQKLHQQELER